MSSQLLVFKLILFQHRVVSVVQIIFFSVVSNLFSFNFWGFIFFMNSCWVFFSVCFQVWVLFDIISCWHKQYFHLLLHLILKLLTLCVSSCAACICLLTLFHYFYLFQEYLRAPVISTSAGFRSTCSAATWSSARGRTAAGLWTCRWSRPMSLDTSPTESGTSWVRARKLLQEREAEMLFFICFWWPCPESTFLLMGSSHSNIKSSGDLIYDLMLGDQVWLVLTGSRSGSSTASLWSCFVLGDIVTLKQERDKQTVDWKLKNSSLKYHHMLEL